MHYIAGMSEESADPANALGKQASAPENAFVLKPKLPLLEIECSYQKCSKKFKQTRSWQKFCSVKCRNDEYWSHHQRVTADVVPS